MIISKGSYDMNEKKEEIFDKLQKSGCRLTKQRRALVDIILESECTCCKELYYLASKKMPEIGLSTIYRMINLLEDVGAIKRDNPYRVCCMDSIPSIAVTVEFEDGEMIELEADAIQRYILEGIKVTGEYDKTIKSIQL